MSNFKNLSLKLKKNARKNHLSDHGSAKLKWHWRKKMGNGEIQKEWNPPENIHIFYSLETMYPNWLIQYDLEPIFKFSTGNNRIEDEKDLFAFFFLTRPEEYCYIWNSSEVENYETENWEIFTIKKQNFLRYLMKMTP